MIYILALLCLFFVRNMFLGAIPLRASRKGTKYVSVEKDGSARELTAEEEEYLSTPFQGSDSGRPYIKLNYWQRTPDGKMHGYLRRNRVPWWIKITDSTAP